MKASPKLVNKENTKQMEIKLHTQQRAAKRAIFNDSVSFHLTDVLFFKQMFSAFFHSKT